MASGAAKNRMLEQKRFFSRKNDAQSLANGDTARWNWTTPVWYLLILEFKSMKLKLFLLPQLLCAIHKVSGSLHLSKLVYSIRVSQSSVATRLRCGGIF